MASDSFWLDANDRSSLYVRRWLPAGTPKAIVLMAHGMAEHSARYERLGNALCAAGFALYAHDQRGHGKTAERGTLGYFADEEGWCAVVSDVANLQQHINQTHPDIAVFCWGTAWAVTSPNRIYCTTAPACTARYSALQTINLSCCIGPRA